MKYSYNDFIKILGLIDTDLSRAIYELYLDCLKKQIENEKKE